MNTRLCAGVAIHPLGDRARRTLARLVGRPALSLRRNEPSTLMIDGSFSLGLAGMSLPRRRLAPALPPKRTISRIQLRFQG